MAEQLNIEALKAQLEVDEDRRHKLYRCSMGYLTGGVGRNFDAKKMSNAVIDLMLQEDVDETLMYLDKWLPWWRKMTDRRQQVLANMCFNLGIGKLLEFKNTLRAMEEGRYMDAAAGMRNSLWARQVGKRAERLALLMEKG